MEFLYSNQAVTMLEILKIFMHKDKVDTKINQMAIFMKVFGLKIYNMAKENNGTLKMGTCLKDNLCMVANLAKEFILKKMELNIKATFIMDYVMVMENIL